VCEDIIRFLANDKAITRSFKLLRHDLKEITKNMNSAHDILASRSVVKDVGKPSTKDERSRRDFVDIFSANARRTEESFRVLEELSKLTDQESSERFKKMRFRLYALEKRSIPKIRAVRDSRCAPGPGKLIREREITCVQLRKKNTRSLSVLKEIKALTNEYKKRGVTVIVNDWVSVVGTLLLSATITTTSFSPISVGFHCIRPVAGSMVISAGLVVKE